MDRIELLKEFLAQDPDDPFNRYALALEYLKTDSRKALELFEQLMESYEGYIPTYYHAGKLLSDLEETERAKQVFQKGIKLAEAAGDAKAARELKNAYSEIEFD